ncbi:MAG TPA: chemotaxis protein CheW [Gammaproteobacteria bacterium]|nr:chemotaxis protein CheW [Gammaproteobacteria bacterium]
MSAEPRELYSLLIPLKQERLLVPRMCVAEVIAFAETKAPEPKAAPDWYLGTVEWNGRQLPVVSFDGATGKDGDGKRGRTRIVVFHAVTRRLRGGYYGILTQGFPQLVRVNQDVLTVDNDRALPDQPVLCRVRMIHEFPLIPDVERLEGMLADVLLAQVAPEMLQ